MTTPAQPLKRGRPKKDADTSGKFPTITTQHSASSYGLPVVLDERGRLMDPSPGVRACLAALGWTQQEFAERCGVKLRTVEHWLTTGLVPAATLNVLRDALAEHSQNKGE